MDTATYDAAVAEMRRLTGADTPQAEATRQAREASHDGACAGCQQPFPADTPVWMCVFSFRGPVGGTSWATAAVCASCYTQRTKWGWLRYRMAGWHGHWAITGVYVCQGCGRQVHAHSATVARYCTDLCHRQARNQRRRVQRAPARCLCGKTFTPARGDARACSSACRQRAYRRRVASAGAR